MTEQTIDIPIDLECGEEMTVNITLGINLNCTGGGGGGDDWHPDQLTTCLAAFEYDYAGSVTVDGDGVSDWADTTGSVSFIQTTEARRPLLVGSGVSYDAITKGMVCPVWAEDIYEIWFVWENADTPRTTWPTYSVWMSGLQGNSGTDQWFVTPANGTLLQNNVEDSQWFPFTQSTVACTSTTPLGFEYLGNRRFFDNGIFGKLKAVYVFGGAANTDVPSTEERATLQAYLVDKYGPMS